MSWEERESGYVCARCGNTWEPGQPSLCRCEALEPETNSKTSRIDLELLFPGAAKKEIPRLKRLATLEGQLEDLVQTYDSIDTDKKWGPAKRAETKAKVSRLIFEVISKLQELGSLDRQEDILRRLEGES